MGVGVNKADIKKLIDDHGESYTDSVIVEEPAELIQAYSKLKRWSSDRSRNRVNIERPDYFKLLDNLIEEMADVYIVLKMIQLRQGIIDKKIQEHINSKMQRNLERIKA